ncbi:MAG TPA: carotenoid biosynthesis protein [Chloroflexi bacterium]|nr:carotenoid biosynthesis protein [Chloroflexota bacterium]
MTSTVHSTFQQLTARIQPRRFLHPATFLVAAWLLTMIAIPILRWVVGDGVLHYGVIAGVILQAAAVLAICHRAWGGRTVLRIAAVVIPLSWLIERIGSATGIPFGAYHYTDALAPLIGGVPAVIPLAWLMMLPPAWAVAYAITGAVRGWRFVLVSGLAFTAWDLFLDPQMVTWGYWVWETPGLYFGIPLVNFAGWLLASMLLSWLARPPLPPLPPLLLVYAAVWFLQSVGLSLFWQMPGPALFGFVAMGAMLVAALMRRRGHLQISLP